MLHETPLRLANSPEIVIQLYLLVKNSYLQYIFYYLYWLIFFAISKGVFLSYHHLNTALLSALEIIKVFLYGFYLDASFSAYICIIPFFLFFLQTINSNPRINKIVNAYTIFLIILITFCTVADLELYKAWGFRLDSTPLQYFSSPQEMLASASSAPVLLLAAIFFLLSVIFIWLYWFVFRRYIFFKSTGKKLFPVITSFIIFIFLFIATRGGFQQVPVNQSDVYFSDKIFANHAAVNVPWNIMHSIFKKDFKKQNPYQYFTENLAGQYLDSLYSNQPHISPEILSNQRPNIIFIILESYTAKFVGCLGGEPGVTPNLDKIAKDGMLFTNIYASGDRTEKGIVSLLSSYPTQTTTSIIKTPRKTENLPHFNLILKQLGYNTSYYYGGELEFANIKSYLLNAGYQRLTTKYNFDSKYYNTKWGVHDHILMSKFLEDLKTETQPFFSTLFTLSSHEPYDVPIPSQFEGSDETTKFKNSFYYTDQAIGGFIEEAKKQAWWDSTLIVFVADHGHRLPGYDSNDKPSKFRIPFILTGGALKEKHAINNVIGSQTDIVKTLLQQMNLPSEKFKWSKSLLDTTARQFAFYIFNDGFGFVTKNGAVTFDNISKKIIYKDPGVTNEQINYGKAYMQLSFQDFLKR